MNITFLTIVTLALLAFFYGQRKIRSVALASSLKQHSLTRYHGAYIAALVFLPAILLMLLWSSISPLLLTAFLQSRLEALGGTLPSGELNVLVAKTKSVAAGVIPRSFVSDVVAESADYFNMLQARSSQFISIVTIILALIGFWAGARKIAIRFPARHKVEKLADYVMMAASALAILTTIGIVLSLIFETLRFFETVSVSEFLFGLQWSPQIAIRADQAGSSGAFGAIPLFAGTFLITIIAMCVAIPIGLLTAVYLSEYASARQRSFIKPALEILAGVPTVVYGFFAALVVAPFLRNSGADIGLTLSSESALAAGAVMGIMIIPFISSLSDDVINAVPQTLRDGAAALGATRSETVKQVIFPAAFPGIVSAILLAVSRAIGETMIVVMAAGVSANLTANPFESVTTITVQIVMLLVGDQEFDSPKTLAAFALGMVLFLITLGLNGVALYISRKYREKYE
jgi:phosphate transport system permease protein